MQLVLNFSVLLASLVVALSVVGTVEAAPIKRNEGLATLSLRRITQARSDVHPQMLLQQHMNRGHKRLAHMTGRAAPSTHELRATIEKRMFNLQSGQVEKRFNRPSFSPHPSAGKSAGANDNSVIDLNGNGNATGSGSDSDSGSSGISPADVEAEENGGLTPADQPTAANSLGLDIEANDVGYIATVQLGTPPRDFRILMDSGSADLWVGSQICQSEQGGGCGNHTFLGSDSSSTFVNKNKNFAVTYGSGSVQGGIIADDVSIAGLSLPGHTFGVATLESVDFSADSVQFDGLMGLAQSTLSQQGVPTPIEALAQSGAVSDAIMAFKLGRVADGDNDGEVTFGGVDNTKFQAGTLVTYPNVNTQGFWEGALGGISVDGTDLGLTNRTAIHDTGTTLVIAPASDAAAVHAAIPGAKSDGQGGFTIPCTSTAVVSLSFGGSEFSIDPRDLLFQPVDPNDLTGDCVSGISSGQVGGADEWLVGDVFLKNVYFVTDVGKNQISLAKLA